MSEIQRLPTVMNRNPIHPNAKSSSQMNNGTTTSKSSISSPVCRNCQTQTTPLWRRDETGQVLCNACGLFLKLHGRPRPISLKTDTIKLRNRIKQPNFSKSLGPNTPELKLKDPKPLSSGKTSPKAKKRLANDSPLSLVHGHTISGLGMNGRVASASQLGTPLANGHPQVDSRQHYHHGSYLPHLTYSGNLPLQVQLLHYPSSTPILFAPGLQRITSPLLLSTTLSVLNARSTTAASSLLSTNSPTGSLTPSGRLSPSSARLTAVQAAGALENMSNELGPSASFKPLSGTSGVSLIKPDDNKLKVSVSAHLLSTPSSALNQLHPPKLPALGMDSSVKSVIASPSFGPQYHLLEKPDTVKADPSDIKHSLPPLHQVSARGSPVNLPHLTPTVQSGAATPEIHVPTPIARVPTPNARVPTPISLAAPINSSLLGLDAYRRAANGPESGSNSNSNSTRDVNDLTADGSRSGPGVPPHSGTGNAGSSSGSGSGSGSDDGQKNNNRAFEISLLKTRISELELVNDLYRTRIMELEAMEQAARLREMSMRRRLDDLLMSQGEEPISSLTNLVKREEPDHKRQKPN